MGFLGGIRDEDAERLLRGRAPGPGRDGDLELTIGEAAEALGVSVETLRRWSDAGQIRVERTPGGHRRFSISDVQRALERQGRRRTRSYRLDPPARPLPSLASPLEDDLDLLTSVRRALYARGPRGWFASEAGIRRTERWLAAVAEAARTGDYRGAITHSRELAKQARISGVSLLECDSFFELFGSAIARELGGRAPSERVTARLLLIVLRQSMLDAYQGMPTGGPGPAGDRRGPEWGPPGEAEGELPAADAAPEALQAVSLAGFLDRLVDLYDVEDGALFVSGEDGMELELAAFSGGGERRPQPPERISLGEGPIGRVALEQRVQMLRAPAWSASGERPAPTRPLLAAPLRDAGRVVGVICLGTRSSRPVEQRELLLLGALADRIAPAVAGRAPDPAASLRTALARFTAAWLSPSASGR
jgi:excisionase family DNA binding protein